MIQPQRHKGIISIDIDADRLLDEVSNRLSLMAESVEAQSQGATFKATKDVLNEGNREILQGILMRHIYDSVNVLYPYCKTPARRRHVADEQDEVCGIYTLTLVYDDELSETSISQLREAIKAYVVYKCQSEWLAMTMPNTQMYVLWEQKAQEAREQIATTLVQPYHPKRLKVTPRFY